MKVIHELQDGNKVGFEVDLLVMLNFTNQKEMVDNAFRAKFVQNQNMNSHKFN
jgi:hypothetical protein